MSISGPITGARLEPVGDLHRAGGLGEPLGEGVVDAVLNQNPVGTDAGLTGVAVFRGDRTPCLRRGKLLTAPSISAASNTMNGALPPNSSDDFLTVPAHCSISNLPTSVEPVEVSLRTIRFEVSSPPIFRPAGEAREHQSPARRCPHLRSSSAWCQSGSLPEGGARRKDLWGD